MGTGIISNGVTRPTPLIDCTNWLDNPALRLRKGEDFKARAPGWIRAVILHTTKGIDVQVRPGLGPAVNAGERVARYWLSDGRTAGAHLVVDHDGRVFQTADIVREETFGCPKWNDAGVHIELYQGRDGEVYEGQLAACVALVDWLTAALRIQRQIPVRYVGPVARLCEGDESATGVLGHRDCARNRGKGDPGNAIFNRLYAAGYEAWNYDLVEDRDVWRRRQRELGVEPADGIPGPKTNQALEAAGRPLGLWVPRPGDV